MIDLTTCNRLKILKQENKPVKLHETPFSARVDKEVAKEQAFRKRMHTGDAPVAFS